MDISKFNLPRTILFDTETTSISPGQICQLSYILIQDGKIIPNNYYFKVDSVDPGAERVHGLSVRRLAKLSDNKTFKDNIINLHNDFNDIELLIGHNLSFDLNFIKTEFSRSKYTFSYIEGLCTMRHFTPICKILKANGGYKWPKLAELTDYYGIRDKDISKATDEIFGTSGIGYHDARFDTVATFLSYIRGLESGHIKIKGLGY